MTRLFILLPFCLFLLPGCMPQHGYTSGLAKKNTIVAETESHFLRYGRGEVQPDKAEKQALTAFLHALPYAAVQHIELRADLEAPTTAPRLKALRRQLAKQGFTQVVTGPFVSSDISPLTADDQPVSLHNNIQILAHTLRVEAPENCPDWRHGAGPGNPHNLPSSNFGCATMRNFGQMVANPADMLGRNSRHHASVDNNNLAIVRYHTSYSTLPEESSSTGDDSE